MSRKLTAATLALTVAGGVYLMAGPAQASNMGFKLERSFKVEREIPTDNRTSFQNIYLLSYSLFNGLGDVGNTAAGGNKCVGDTGSAAVPDGTIDSTDSICDHFTSRDVVGNSFAFNRFNPATCRYESQTAARTGFGLQFGGSAFSLSRDEGYYITVGGTATPAAENRAVIVGSHDPSYTGTPIAQPIPDCTPRNKIVPLPYHMMIQKANEVLCGLEGVDWDDVAPADGNPDTCPAGIWDGVTTNPVHAISVGTFDNINDDSLITRDNEFSFRGVTFSFGRLQFSGPNYDLTPGDAYIVSISPNHITTTLLVPHF